MRGNVTNAKLKFVDGATLDAEKYPLQDNVLKSMSGHQPQTANNLVIKIFDNFTRDDVMRRS